MEKVMKKISCIVVLASCVLTGCTGMEIGGKLWATRVDEKQESQASHNTRPLPLKCYLWADCSNNTVAGQKDGYVGS